MHDIWQHALRDLQTKVSAHNFESWFKNIRFHHQNGPRAYLEVADDFFKAWIEDNYLDLIEDSLGLAIGEPVEVVIDVEGAYDVEMTELSIDVDESPVAARMARSPSGATVVQGALFDSPEELTRPTIVAGTDDHELKRRILEAGMNPRYTFEEYVVGPSNQFTYAASTAVAQKSGTTYNPLFIFGGVGLGKTHLLQAVGIEALKKDLRTRVVYLSSEEFMNQLIT
ncbi:MAG: DnaA ATPase domain-containing protein, partial [Bradymonadaceae bacterium]